jgi:hypothetical protein
MEDFNLWQRILLGDFMPDLNCPNPGGTEVLARNPDGSTNLLVNYKNATDISLFSELLWLRLK